MQVGQQRLFDVAKMEIFLQEPSVSGLCVVCEECIRPLVPERLAFLTRSKDETSIGTERLCARLFRILPQLRTLRCRLRPCQDSHCALILHELQQKNEQRRVDDGQMLAYCFEDTFEAQANTRQTSASFWGHSWYSNMDSRRAGLQNSSSTPVHHSSCIRSVMLPSEARVTVCCSCTV